MTTLDQAFGSRDGEALLRAVLHDCPDAIVITDNGGSIIGINDAAELLFGWRAAELVGRPMDVLHAEIGGAPSLSLAGSNEPDGALGRGDRRYRHSGGEVFIGETVGTVVNDDSGRVLGAMTIVRDVTDHRRTMIALSDLYSVTSSRDLRYQDKVERILEIGCTTFGLVTGVVARLEGELLTVSHSVGGGDEFGLGRQFDRSNALCGRVLTSSKALAIEDTEATEAVPSELYGDARIGSYLGATLNVDGERFGTIAFFSPDARLRPFSGQDVELVRLFGEWIGNEIARERDFQALRNAHDRLRRLASTDELTGVGNRRHFMSLARHDWERMRRTGRPLSLLVVDLDRFKRVNDEHGHAVGDDLLTTVACECRRSLRSADVFGRIGGEEFAVLLPETEPDRALEVAERLRATVESAAVDAPAGSVHTTASIGLANAGPEDLDLAMLMTRADGALYQAKESGRNQVVVADAVRA